jgi:hypothetical protein
MKYLRSWSLGLWSLAGVLIVVPPAALAQDKPATPAQPAAEAKPASTVKLLDPGAEPRIELRYAPKAGVTNSMTMRMKMSTKADVGGRPMDVNMPAMLMTIDMTTKEIKANGDIAYEAVFSKMDVEETEGADPMMTEGIRSALGSMKGTVMTGVMSSRGEMIQSDIKLPAGANPMSRQMMDNMKQSMNQLSAPLPTEPVGKGAKWDVVTSVGNMGMKIDQTATMTLTEVSLPSYTLDFVIKQKADKQEVKMPGVPAGISVELVSHTSDGTGQTRTSTESLLPLDSKMTMTSEQVMNVSPPGEAQQTMTQGLKMEVSMKTAPKAEKKEPEKGEKPAEAPKQ